MIKTEYCYEYYANIEEKIQLCDLSNMHQKNEAADWERNSRTWSLLFNVYDNDRRFIENLLDVKKRESSQLRDGRTDLDVLQLFS